MYYIYLGLAGATKWVRCDTYDVIRPQLGRDFELSKLDQH